LANRPSLLENLDVAENYGKRIVEVKK